MLLVSLEHRGLELPYGALVNGQTVEIESVRLPDNDKIELGGSTEVHTGYFETSGRRPMKNSRTTYVSKPS